MAEFEDGGSQFFSKLDRMRKECLFGFHIISQNAAKVKERHGYEGVAEEEMFEMDEREEADDLDAGYWILDAGCRMGMDIGIPLRGIGGLDFSNIHIH